MNIVFTFSPPLALFCQTAWAKPPFDRVIWKPILFALFRNWDPLSTNIDETHDDVVIVGAVWVYRMTLIVDVAYRITVKEYRRKPIRLVVGRSHEILQRWIIEAGTRRHIERARISWNKS